MLSAIVTLTALAALPSTADALERVTDGGFENNDPAWTLFGAAVCTTALCPGESAAGGSRWLGLGGGTAAAAGENKISQASQTVTITPPATLTLLLRIQPGVATTRKFSVLMDASNTLVTQVDHVVSGGYASYTLVSASLDAFPGTHELKLHTQSFATTMNDAHARFQIDNVSIQDASVAPPTEPDPPTDPDPTEPTPPMTPEPPSPTCKGKVATIVGTDEGELLDGTPKADVIYAAAGNDVVRSGAGNDVVCAGAGDDEVKGAAGKDRLYGDEGRDKLNGGGGEGDRCVGGPSRDKATSSCEKSKTL